MPTLLEFAPWRFPAQVGNATNPREVCGSLNSPLAEFMAAERAINLVFFLGALALVVVTMVQLKRLSSKSFCQTENMIKLTFLAVLAAVLVGLIVSYSLEPIMRAQEPYVTVGQALVSLSSLLLITSLLSIATAWVHVAANAKVRTCPYARSLYHMHH